MADESNALMRLPDGRTCGDCAHFPKCAQLVGAKERWVQCDWFPSRFRAREVASIAADRHAALLRLVTECRKQQRCYFQTRSRWALDAAKAAEKELDAFLEQTMPGGGGTK